MKRDEGKARDGIDSGDIALASAAGVGTVVMWVVQLAAVPVFAEMLSAFGGELPRITVAVLELHVALIASTVVMIAVGAGIALRWATGRWAGRIMMVIGVLVPCLVVPLQIGAMYMPIFALADAVG